MSFFADTSLLCALYRDQDNAETADALVRGLRAPLAVSSLVAFEFRQATRLQIFRFANDRKQGFSRAEANRMLGKLELNIASGALEITSAEWPDVHSLAERLSAKHTASSGCRTLDVLHVATALHCGSDALLTFDANQARLARAEGLKVLPAQT